MSAKNSQTKLIIHPVRMRIIQALAGRSLTTQEIAAALPDQPVSSLYRHLKKLLAGEVITVVETRPVKGIEEKVYALAAPAVGRLTPAEIAGVSSAEHMQMFTTFVGTLLQGFNDYLDAADQPLEFVADRVGYSEVPLYATDDEFDAFVGALNQALLARGFRRPPDSGGSATGRG